MRSALQSSNLQIALLVFGTLSFFGRYHGGIFWSHLRTEQIPIVPTPNSDDAVQNALVLADELEDAEVMREKQKKKEEVKQTQTCK